MEERKPKIIVAHPGKQHSFRLATALKKADMLDCYCTTVYDKNTSIWMKCAKMLAKGDNRKRAENRKCTEINDEYVVQACELLGLITIACTRLDKSTNRKLYRKINGITSVFFGRKIANIAIEHNADAVICYDTAARACWEILKKQAPQIRRIMDVSHAARPEEKRIFEKEVEDTRIDVLKQENIHLWNHKILEMFQKEIDLTDYFICPSNFVIETLMKCGVLKEQCYRVPYGANIQSEGIKEKIDRKEVKFIYVGNTNYAKGVHYLLRAFSHIDINKATLTIVGSYNTDNPLYKEYCQYPNIAFTGWVLQDEVKRQYNDSDVFVIFSPTEGLAQVGIEAMSCGLPVICADSTGVNDLIINGVNGFVVPYGDEQCLTEKMEWMIDNKEKIHEMGINAQMVAREYTWEKYETNVNSAISEILRKD